VVLELDPLDEPGLLQVSKAISRRTLLTLREHLAEVVRAYDSERPNRGQRLTLRTVQLVRSLPVANQLAVSSTRQIDVTNEDVPPVVVAEFAAVAVGSSSPVSLERVVPAPPFVVSRVVTVQHDFR
jgi:hypothetical protein